MSAVSVVDAHSKRTVTYTSDVAYISNEVLEELLKERLPEWPFYQDYSSSHLIVPSVYSPISQDQLPSTCCFYLENHVSSLSLDKPTLLILIIRLKYGASALVLGWLRVRLLPTYKTQPDYLTNLLKHLATQPLVITRTTKGIALFDNATLSTLKSHCEVECSTLDRLPLKPRTAVEIKEESKRKRIASPVTIAIDPMRQTESEVLQLCHRQLLKTWKSMLDESGSIEKMLAQLTPGMCYIELEAGLRRPEQRTLRTLCCVAWLIVPHLSWSDGHMISLVEQLLPWPLRQLVDRWDASLPDFPRPNMAQNWHAMATELVARWFSNAALPAVLQFTCDMFDDYCMMDQIQQQQEEDCTDTSTRRLGPMEMRLIEYHDRCMLITKHTRLLSQYNMLELKQPGQARCNILGRIWSLNKRPCAQLLMRLESYDALPLPIHTHVPAALLPRPMLTKAQEDKQLTILVPQLENAPACIQTIIEELRSNKHLKHEAMNFLASAVFNFMRQVYRRSQLAFHASIEWFQQHGGVLPVAASDCHAHGITSDHFLCKLYILLDSCRRAAETKYENAEFYQAGAVYEFSCTSIIGKKRRDGGECNLVCTTRTRLEGECEKKGTTLGKMCGGTNPSDIEDFVQNRCIMDLVERRTVRNVTESEDCNFSSRMPSSRWFNCAQSIQIK